MLVALERETCDSSKYRQYRDRHVRVLGRVTGAYNLAAESIVLGEGFKLVSISFFKCIVLNIPGNPRAWFIVSA
jgi:hypothetical protein